MFALPISWLIASIAGQAISIAICPPPIAAALVILSGVLLAADARLPIRALGGSAILFGLLRGESNGAEFIASHAATLNSIGVAISVFSLATVIAAQAVGVRPTVRIAVRVIGSWIAAIGIFMLGWSMRS